MFDAVQPGGSLARAGAENSSDFSEAGAWAGVRAGWRQLAGGFRRRGFSFECHEFHCATDLDWSASFHPGSIELCLNLEGEAEVAAGGQVVQFTGRSVGFYCRGEGPIQACRRARGRHVFLTVEYSQAFLARHAAEFGGGLHRLVAGALQGKPLSGVSEVRRMSAEFEPLVLSLRQPPVLAAARALWYEAKALELVTAFFFLEAEELFCTRQQRLAQDRAARVVAILKRDLAEPPTLEAIAREAGCSPFHLSRIFSRQMGRTIPQFLRQLRMERAAELLRGGDYNVTEAALEVGYNSLSHFSAAFHETFGCCPGLYPMATRTQKAARGRRSG